MPRCGVCEDAMERLELEDIQGLIPYAYVGRPYARYWLLCVVAEHRVRAGRWLRGLTDYVGAADPYAKGKRPPPEPGVRRSGKAPCLAIAFTHEGLEALGLSSAALAGFVPEFRQGMAHPHRSRVLGDTARNAPSHWLWGRSDYAAHVLVAAFDDDFDELSAFMNAKLAAAEGAVELCYELDAKFREGPGSGRDLREPFGFRDGISQPYVEEFGRPPPLHDAPSNRVRAGEFVLGYRNELDRLPLSPTLARMHPHDRLLPQASSGVRDLGKNGTYLVVRQFVQDVPEFQKLAPEVQAKLMGRWPSGAPLALSPEQDRPDLATRNDFGFFERDRAGMRCPVGSHVRRSNPRDGFADQGLPLTAAESLATVNQHRLLRRGRPFERNHEHGVFFICLNANIERQFEFVQQAWLNNPAFMGLNGERDFAAGAATPFTVPYCGGRERYALPAYVQVRGGGYFFLPGRRALAWIAEEAIHAPV
jgi:Dyp-type peroxidase family